MIYQGRNLIVTVNGKVIAGAKSCDIEIDCDVIPVSSPSDGNWEHVIGGLKAWKINTNHLLGMDVVPSHTILAVGTSHKAGQASDQSYCIVNGTKYNGGTRGLQLREFEWDATNSRWVSKYLYQYDTYGSTDALSAMVSDLNSDVDDGDLVIITSYDAYAINDALSAALINVLDLHTDSVPVVEASRSSFVCVAIAGQGGVAFVNTNPGSNVHATLLLDDSRHVISETPIKTAAQMVGTIVTVSLQADGLAYDRLTGQALVRTWKARGSLGNLASGDFSFVGNGPLE